MDCRTAKLLLDFGRPLSTELDASEAEALQEHLADCAECGPLARMERSVDEQLSKAMRAVAVPEGLRNRLVSRLDGDHRHRQRTRFLKIGSALTAAAALLLSTGIGWHAIRKANLPPVDPEEAWRVVSNQIGNPSDVVEDWFKTRYAFRTKAPTQLNYRFLTYYDMANFQNQRVPMLLFVRGEDRAFVYILSDSQFNLATLDQNPTGYKVQVLHHPTDQHLAYLVIYTSEEVGVFLEDKDQSSAT